MHLSPTSKLGYLSFKYELNAQIRGILLLHSIHSILSTFYIVSLPINEQIC